MSIISMRDTLKTLTKDATLIHCAVDFVKDKPRAFEIMSRIGFVLRKTSFQKNPGDYINNLSEKDIVKPFFTKYHKFNFFSYYSKHKIRCPFLVLTSMPPEEDSAIFNFVSKILKDDRFHRNPEWVLGQMRRKNKTISRASKFISANRALIATHIMRYDSLWR